MVFGNIIKFIFLKFNIKIERVLPQIVIINGLVETKIGNYFIKINSNNPLYSTYHRYPEFGKPLQRISSLLKKYYPDASVIDIGANVGDTVAIIKSGGNLTVLAIEGDKYCYQILMDNCMQFDSVICKNVFLGEKSGEIPVIIEKSGWNTTLVPNNAGKMINFWSLDDFLIHEKIDYNFKLIKLDTEGFEFKIIRGAKKNISHRKPIIFLEYNTSNLRAINENRFSFIDDLKLLGYSKLFFYDSMGNFILTCAINETPIIHHLLNFIDNNTQLHYYDICFFHAVDLQMANAFEQSEINHRNYINENKSSFI